MIVLKIIAVSLGLSFSILGYLIFFKKKYSLLNKVDSAFKSGNKNENYAKRIGLVYFVVGIAILIAAIMLILFD